MTVTSLEDSRNKGKPKSNPRWKGKKRVGKKETPRERTREVGKKETPGETQPVNPVTQVQFPGNPVIQK